MMRSLLLQDGLLLPGAVKVVLSGIEGMADDTSPRVADTGLAAGSGLTDTLFHVWALEAELFEALLDLGAAHE